MKQFRRSGFGWNDLVFCGVPILLTLILSFGVYLYVKWAIVFSFFVKYPVPLPSLFSLLGITLIIIWWMVSGASGFSITMGYFDRGFKEDKEHSRWKILGPVYFIFVIILLILYGLYAFVHKSQPKKID